MDTLIKQLTTTIENRDGITHEEAVGKALREIVLSGLSRSGFLKECPYLSGFDLYRKDLKSFSMCFLYQNDSENFQIGTYLPFVNIELEAAGSADAVCDAENRFSVEYDGVLLSALVFRHSFDLKPVYSYQQQPIPYELRAISAMLEGIRAEIEKDFEIEQAFVDHQRIAKKNPAKSSGKKKKQANETSEKWVQPSLFDF